MKEVLSTRTIIPPKTSVPDRMAWLMEVATPAAWMLPEWVSQVMSFPVLISWQHTGASAWTKTFVCFLDVAEWDSREKAASRFFDFHFQLSVSAIAWFLLTVVI